MASEAEVRDVLRELVGRLENLDPAYRAMLPNRRTVEAECPDLQVVYHATWARDRVSDFAPGPASRRPDIRVTVDSDDLVALGEGRLDFARAYADGRVSIRAGMTDLIRLQAVL